MPLAQGERIGPYEIVAPIGEGGMGVVYKARDTRLQREVAIKFSQADFDDRFEREALAIAALNHPNICTLHDVGSNYLVMELVEGPTLAERIAQGPIPVEEAIPLALQLAAAIEAAHERGIIHRDLKPDNIKLTAQGIKVLDFGLAKAAAPTGPADASAPTIKAGASLAGIIIGTPGYMSPEQASGKPIDRRTDVWSFGVVLWEMVTGRRMFEGETISHTLAAVLTQKPDVSLAPATLRPLLARCLVQDPRQRMRDIGEVRLALENPQTAEPAASVAVPSKTPWRWIAALSIAALLVCLAILFWPSKAVERPLVSLEVDMGVPLPPTFSSGSSVVISPDGTRIAYLDGTRKLYARRLSDPQPTLLSSTPVMGPFWSPDSKWIGFLDTKVRKVLADGGTPVPLCDIPVEGESRGATWADGGFVIASLTSSGGLVKIPDSGGTPQPMTQLDAQRKEITHRFPEALPGGKAVLFTTSTRANNFEQATVDVLVLATGERKTLIRGATFPRYLHSGHILYTNNGTVFAIAFDLDKLEVRGSPVPVLSNVLYQSNIGYSHLSASRDGVVIHRRGGRARSGNIHWLGLSGEMGPLVVENFSNAMYALSADARRLAYVRESSIWIKDVQTGASTRLTFEDSRSPVFTPTGDYLLYGSTAGLFSVRSDGAGKPVKMHDRREPMSFSPDGKYLFVVGPDGAEVASIELGPDGPKIVRSEPIYSSERVLSFPEFSPDGKWIAYRAVTTGTRDVFVRAFPDTGAKYQISTQGGSSPTWSRDRNELIWVTAEGRIMSTPYQRQGNALAFGQPRPVSEKNVTPGVGKPVIAAPGNRLLVVLSNSNGKPETTAVFLFHFHDELRRRFATAGQ